MSFPAKKIIWSNSAKSDLRSIYRFIAAKSLPGAQNVVNDIRQSIRSIHFEHQHQIDPYVGSCMYIAVRNYKVLYTIDLERNELNIVRVFDTRRDPSKLKG